MTHLSEEDAHCERGTLKAILRLNDLFIELLNTVLYELTDGNYRAIYLVCQSLNMPHLHALVLSELDLVASL